MPSLSRRAFLGTSLASLTIPYIPGGQPEIGALQTPTTAPGSDTVFLTWQRDPTRTMTVQWVGPEVGPLDDVVSYAPRGADHCLWLSRSASTHLYPLTCLRVHRVELDGLTPNTDYQFRIGNADKIYRFRTMPATATDVIHFVSGGDCGTGPHAVGNNIAAARQDPMFALIGGDLAYENGRSAATHLAFLRNYSRHMIGAQDRMIPMLACIGNHEVNGNGPAPRAKAPFFYAMFGGLFRDSGYATLDFGNYLSLILLDTGHTTSVRGEQTDWLERQLRARIDHPHVIVANHVPAYPSAREMEGRNGVAGTGSPNRSHWVPLFDRYRVPVVLEHHDHTFKRSKLLLDGHENDNGVLYLGDGSWGQLRAPNRPERLSHLALVRQDYHLSLHRLEGEQRFHVALAENGRVMDIYRTAQRRRGTVAAGR